MKNTIHFLFLLLGLTLVGCNKDKNINPSGGGEKSLTGCEFQYGTAGYVVQEDGILNFIDLNAFTAFLDTITKWSDSEITSWETTTGANTAYGNYIEAENALSALMTPYENDSLTTEEEFQPIFNAFVQSHSHLASITSEGVEPYFPFPFYYFANQDGIYRICDQEYSVQGGLLFSYPFGQQELVNTWNGQIGEFGDLSVQRIVQTSSGEVLEERDELVTHECTSSLDKKRIKVKWKSNTWKKTSSGYTVYYWLHEGEIKAQKKVLGVWVIDHRSISLAVNGWIRNRHEHPNIPLNTTWPINFFKCEHTNKIKEVLVSETFGTTIVDSQNKFAFDLNITGANRTGDCQTVQFYCSIIEEND